MRLLKQSSTAQPLVFLLVQSSDHITGLTGASPTVTLSKSGAAFGAAAGTVTEIGSGWYKVAGNATDTNTLGPLALHATAASADPCDLEYAVLAVDPQSANAFITGVNSIAPPVGWNLPTFTGTPTIGGTGTLTITGAVATQAGTLPITTTQMLLSTGTGTGQLDFTSGVVKGNVTQLLGTAWLTPGTPGTPDVNVVSIATAAVASIWNALTSGMTTAGSIAKRIIDNLTGDIYARLGAPIGASTSADIAAVKSDTGGLRTDFTTARAGYLDNLNVGGAVASHADFLAINTSASKHLLMQTVGQYERPESGSTLYPIEVRTFSASTGAAVNADSTPTLTAAGTTSGDVSANLSAATNPATGVYRWTYTVASGATQEPIRFDVSAAIASSTFTLSTYSQVVDEVAATFTSTDKSNLTAVFNKLPSGGNIGTSTLVQTDIVSSGPISTTGGAVILVVNVSNLQTGAILSSSFAAGAITAIGTGVWATTVRTLSDKTGFALTTAEHTAIAGDVLNATATSYNTAGTIGSKVNSAASAGDPWSTNLPGPYVAGQAGYILSHASGSVAPIIVDQPTPIVVEQP